MKNIHDTTTHRKSKTRPPLHKAFVRRWAEILLSSILGASIAAAAAPFISSYLSNYFKTIQSRGIIIPLAATIASIVLLVCLLRKRGPTHRLHVLIKYPPPFIGGGIGFFLLTAYWFIDAAAWQSISPGETTKTGASIVFLLGGTPIVGLATIILIASYLTRRSIARGSPLLTLASTSAPNQTDESAILTDWLTTDLPITRTDQDAFGHAAIARRITRRLSGSDENSRAPAIAVVGPLGSGKTSLRKLVERYMLDNRLDWRVKIVSFSAWPFDTTSALVAGILSSIVEATEANIGTRLLQSIPEQYVSIIEGAVGNWSRLARLLDQANKPEEILRRVDEVAAAIGVRVVLWVEDLERFAASEAPSDSNALRETLGPVRALLHLLQEMESVTIVVAAPNLASGFDLEKLARFVEVLQPPTREQTVRLLTLFRANGQASLKSKKIIDAASSRSRNQWHMNEGQLDVITLALASIGGPPETRLGPALAAICNTPRSLKQALRSCNEIWAQYAGEIDFDHVLAISLLRHGQPAAFAAIVPLVDGLRNSTRHREGQPKPWDELSVTLARVAPDKRIQTAIHTVIFELFSASNDTLFPQGFSRTSPVDYWRRYLAMPELDSTDHDQTILQSIEKLVSGDPSEIASFIQNENGGRRFEAFATNIDAATLISLLDAQLTNIRGSRYSSWNDTLPLGLSSTWRLMLSLSRSQQWSGLSLASLLHRHIEKCTTENLALVDVMLYWFASSEDKIRDLLSEQERKTTKDAFVDALVKSYGEAPDALAASLADCPSWLLARLCFGIERVRQPDKNMPFESWSTFAVTILRAAEKAPLVMIPQIATFITTSHLVHTNSDLDTVYKFDSDAAERLFGAEQVLKLFNNTDVEVEYPLEVRSQIQAIVDATKHAKHVAPTAT